MLVERGNEEKPNKEKVEQLVGQVCQWRLPNNFQPPPDFWAFTMGVCEGTHSPWREALTGLEVERTVSAQKKIHPLECSVGPAAWEGP